MGLFNTLMTKIFGASTSAPSGGANRQSASTPTASTPAGSSAASTAAPASSTAGQAPTQQVDVAATLNPLAAKNAEKLDWKHSIVDLMKLVGMDSSLAARKELADDLHYTGDKSDSASMNIWLHKEVLKKLSENGGHVPADLLNK
jgi:hypothetical protein